MAYDTRYEPSASFIMNGVLTWCQTYLVGGTSFTGTTQPTITQAETLINMRVEELGAILVAAGYAASQPLATVGSDVLTLLSRAIIFGVVMDIEMTKHNQAAGRGESQRWQLFERRYKELIALIQGSALEQMGAVRERYASNGLKFTGASWNEQNTIETDTDRKGALFPRGAMDPPSERRQPNSWALEYENQ